MSKREEVWQRNEPVDGLLPIFQPLAFTLLEAKEEIEIFLEGFPEALLYERPANCASVAFHLKHIAGFLDRIFTYAEGKMLDEKQLEYLGEEESTATVATLSQLIASTGNSILDAVEKLKSIPEGQIFVPRELGRSRIPVTAWGLYVHAAEHTMRHVGQLLVTTRVLMFLK